MKGVTIVCFIALAALAYARPEDKEQYTDKYDNIDYDEIINNPRLLHPYILCCLDKGKCTAEGKELKSHMQDALETNCSKCTETQRTASRKIIKHMINNEPDFWTQLCNKFDPTGKYATKYEEELREVKEN